MQTLQLSNENKVIIVCHTLSHAGTWDSCGIIRAVFFPILKLKNFRKLGNLNIIWTVNGFLFKTFSFDSDLPLDTDLENEKTSKIVLAEMLGDMIWEDLSECLIKNCLVYSIPTNSSKLQQYEEVSAEIPQKAVRNCRCLLVSFVFPWRPFAL